MASSARPLWRTFMERYVVVRYWALLFACGVLALDLALTVRGRGQDTPPAVTTAVSTATAAPIVIASLK
jgi:hypothetical protein